MTTEPFPPSMYTALSVLDSLVRAGMRQVVVAPGSRSAPLAYAVAALDNAQVVTSHVRIDERVAGFTALGLAKRSRTPVGLVVTSGTAVGQLLPAVMEAYHTGIPLVVLSADRPRRLHGSGANQTTRQLGIFSHFVRAQVELENYPDDGEEEEGFSRVLAALVGRDPQNWNLYSDQPIGPVHINMGFDVPLYPAEDSAPLLERWAQTLREIPVVDTERSLDTDMLTWLELDSSRLGEAKTVVVAGDGAGEIAQRFAQKHHLPLLAEPSSGARFSHYAIPGYRQVLAEGIAGEIERVVLFGHPTLSRQVSALLQDPQVESALYCGSPAAWFEPGRRRETVFTSIAGLARFAGTGADSWLKRWQGAGAQAWDRGMERVNSYRDRGRNEGRAAGMSLALDCWEKALKHDEILVCGSSNLIRDLDFIAPVAERAPLVYASRGLAGIDGTVATASGISLAAARRCGAGAGPVRLLVGDLTFLHDMMALNIGPLELLPNLEIEVLDDGGGGIFATLEHGKLGQYPGFAETVNRYFTTPHGADLGRLAAALGESRGIRVRVHKVS